MMPASFAIPYLLTAPLPPSMTIGFVRAKDAACRPPAQACFVDVHPIVRNHSNRTLFVDSVSVALGPKGGFHRPFNPPFEIPPFADRELPETFAFHAQAPHHLRFSYHAAGERPRERAGEFETSPGVSQLIDAARLTCLRCGGRKEACSCDAPDGWHRCTSATQCQGACVFERLEQLPEPVCTAPNGRCGVYPPEGFRVGHCSQFKVPAGCLEILTADDSESRPISMLAGRNVKCWAEAVRVTESSPRR
jgi:hypothetical protein